MLGIGVLAIGSILYLGIGMLCSRNLKVTTYTVEAPIQNKVRIVQLSDLHNKEFGPENADLIQKVKQQEPDIIVMTGDMLEWDNPDISIVCNLVRDLKKIAPVYYGYGNHEYNYLGKFQKEIDGPFEEAGAIILTVLIDEKNVNDSAVCLASCHFAYRDWESHSKNPDWISLMEDWADEFENKDGFHILISHSPTTFIQKNNLDQDQVELVLSGDYHGGVFRIPFLDRGVYVPELGLFPKFTKGVMQGAKGTLVVSAGLGDAHHIPRVFNPPEIVVIDLVPE